MCNWLVVAQIRTLDPFFPTPLLQLYLSLGLTVYYVNASVGFSVGRGGEPHSQWVHTGSLGSLTAGTGRALCPCYPAAWWGVPGRCLEDCFGCRRLQARSINQLCAKPHGEFYAGLRYQWPPQCREFVTIWGKYSIKILSGVRLGKDAVSASRMQSGAGLV